MSLRLQNSVPEKFGVWDVVISYWRQFCIQAINRFWSKKDLKSSQNGKFEIAIIISDGKVYTKLVNTWKIR